MKNFEVLNYMETKGQQVVEVLLLKIKTFLFYNQV